LLKIWATDKDDLKVDFVKNLGDYFCGVLERRWCNGGN
jgi:hypothetical protein